MLRNNWLTVSVQDLWLQNIRIEDLGQEDFYYDPISLMVKVNPSSPTATILALKGITFKRYPQ
jgi:hypothetical protein